MLKRQGEQALKQVEDQGLLLFDSRESRLQATLDLLISTCLEVDKKRSPPRRLDLIGRDLKLYEEWLIEAHRHFNEASRQNAPLTYASEWVLDNYYILHQAVQQIKEDMPPSFYRQLPVLIPIPQTAYPRSYFIAYQILKQQSYLLEISDLHSILIHLQDEVPLTMGELWALPIFLRYCLIEKLANALLAIIHPSRPPVLPHRIFPEANAGLALPTEEVNDNDVVANIVISLRTISEQDWKDFFEEVSRLERTLREDPSGLYACMDFATRDLYRKEIEKLSFTSGRSENELAEALLQMAGPRVTVLPGSSDGDDEFQGMRRGDEVARSGMHVGEFLLGDSREIYEKRIGYEPDLKTRAARWMMKNASGFYLAGNFLIAAILCALFLRLIDFPGIVVVGQGSVSPATWSITNLAGRWIVLTVLFLLFGFAALSIASSLVNWLATLIVGPRILPKLDFTEEIPEDCRTLVVIPGMIHSHEDVDSLVQQIELHYLRNPVSGLSFALLTDFRDADCESLPEDESLIEYANQQIERLNEKYRGEIGREDSDRFTLEPLFFFLHRKRLWNPAERKWMGWERKRGKLHELNLFLRGRRDLSFNTLTEEMYELGHPLQNIRFVITLDADTVLPREAASRLVGTLAHPLNRAEFDPKTGRVTSGYTILQPRMEIFPRSIGYSWFTRIFAGDAGLDLYTLAVSDTYQDLFGEGIYVGKGIYDVDAFTRSVNDRIHDNTILSHDLLEGLIGRAGLVTDITMIEEYPQNYIIQAMRQRRWIRGDWQLLPWLFRAKHFGVSFSSIDQ